MTAPILAKIVSYVAEEGIEELASWIRTGKEGKIAVLSQETLFPVRLDRRFRTCDLNESLVTLERVKDVYGVANLAYHMLLSCAGTLKSDDYYALKKKYSFEALSRMANSLMYHIYMVGPRRWGTYSETWHVDDFPHCWEEHDMLGECNGERCMDCILFYLARDIMLVS
ncbi:hypothetical protein CARUB_v10012344mg [Capsella rubella]|uniref:Uncharacterized protein n=1 Tax=Capsella rubella TaxID=81985 RepID=R0IIJ9_9BRAS|nr:hypothetical protein CARUB_v10012344mg [Capsella rubella]